MKNTTIFMIVLWAIFAGQKTSSDEYLLVGNTTNSLLEKVNADELPNSIIGKTLCGYQGWFNAKGDGAELGWKHYANDRKFEPGLCSIDYWPDLTEFDEDEKYSTPFSLSDGRPAKVFSSANPKTVNRHFNWMKDYTIDGVFVQRFVSNFGNAKLHANLNKIYDNCFNASKNSNRLISVMYDLSGSKSTNVVTKTKNDWKRLVDIYNINNAAKTNVLTLKGKAVVAIWGVGFKNRDYTLANIKELIRFFKEDPVYGNCTVLLGVPTGWRTLSRDAIADKELLELVKIADIVHPWSPGRYKNLAQADQHKEDYTIKDKEWCDANGLLYMPVVFPGFSWHNLRKGEAPLDAIPRLKGDFLWRQMYNAISSDAETIYVAMFDEIDEGTCIFKVTDTHPIGESSFLDYEGLPSDYYLWLTGQANKMLRGDISRSEIKPIYNSK